MHTVSEVVIPALSTRRGHQRSLESMQASLEAEIRTRNEAVRLRKKMESDLNEMEIQLGHANRQAADSQRIIRHLQTQVPSPDQSQHSTVSVTRDGLCSVTQKVCRLLPQVREQQVDLEDKVQLTNQLREQIVLLERRCTLMTAEDEELRGILEQTDRARKMAEHELVEVAERVNLLTSQVTTHSQQQSVRTAGQDFLLTHRSMTRLCFRTQVW